MAGKLSRLERGCVAGGALWHYCYGGTGREGERRRERRRRSQAVCFFPLCSGFVDFCKGASSYFFLCKEREVEEEDEENEGKGLEGICGLKEGQVS
mmetsp:Transcript_9900/g.19197  ORF Transcript_9900/g.19197 Transcript_9900/m.19197 type:complete len:96 (+) Transcript_9900:979-1266(+)